MIDDYVSLEQAELLPRETGDHGTLVYSKLTQTSLKSTPVPLCKRELHNLSMRLVVVPKSMRCQQYSGDIATKLSSQSL